MQHPHSGQARFTDLRRADQVEAAVGREAQALLAMLTDSQPASALGMQIAQSSALAKVAGGIRMRDKAADAKVWIACGDVIDQRPETACVARCVMPAGKIGSGI
jgi:predicted ATP-dependent serine protease